MLKYLQEVQGDQWDLWDPANHGAPKVQERGATDTGEEMDTREMETHCHHCEQCCGPKCKTFDLILSLVISFYMTSMATD